MQALILAGGEGTRLRPLTSTVPKPVVPLVDRPFIAFMLEWLRGHGVDDVVISCGFMASGVHNVLGDGIAYGIRLRYVEEPKPLGTGGAIKFAEPLLDERFLVLNGDVLTDIDLTAQLAQHERTGARATLALIAGRGPLGLRARAARRRRARARVPREAEPGPDRHEPDQRRRLRAGARRARRRAGGPARLDRARGLPDARRQRPLRLRGVRLLARHRHPRALPAGDVRHPRRRGADLDRRAYDAAHVALADDAQVAGRVVGPAVVGPGAQVAEGALVGGRTRARPRRLDRRGGARRRARSCSTAPSSARTARSRDCIVGPGAQLGAHCRIGEGVVLGEGVMLGAGNQLAAGARLFPNVSLPDGAIKF